MALTFTLITLSFKTLELSEILPLLCAIVYEFLVALET
jgi:hypothetical protein